MATDKIPITLRLPEKVLEQVRSIAKEEGRSVNNLIEFYIKIGLDRYANDKNEV